MQLKLSSEFDSNSSFGGELALGKRKSRRPVSTKRAMHTVLRSNYSGLRKFRRPLASLLEKEIGRWGMKLYKASINSNHIHLCTKAAHPDDYKNFLRTFSALSARLVTGARKGRALAKKFWAVSPFSRIVAWGRAMDTVLNYIGKNQLEAAGQIAYRPRDKRRAGKGPPRPPSRPFVDG